MQTRKKWKSGTPCIVLFLTLLLVLTSVTACGGKSGSSSASQEAAAAQEAQDSAAAQEASTGSAQEAAETTPAAQNTTGSAVDSAALLPEGIAYQANGITISISKVSEEDHLWVLGCEITNSTDQTLNVDLTKLLINGKFAVNGLYYVVEPSETYADDFFSFDMSDLLFAGIKDVDTVDAYLEITDENENLIAEPEIIHLAQYGTGHSDVDIEHSADIVFEKDGIEISYLGSYFDSSNFNRAVYLVTNDFSEMIRVYQDYYYEVDGESDEKITIWSNTPAIPAGTKGLVSLFVLDSETYEAVPFDTADTNLIISSVKDYKTIGMFPVHLTMDGDKSTSVADNSDHGQFEFVAYNHSPFNDDSETHEYWIYFFESGSKNLTGIIVEHRIPASMGITAETLGSTEFDAGFESSYPGITSLSFRDTLIDENDSFSSYVMIFRDLDDPDNYRALAKTGIIPDPYLSDSAVVSVEDRIYVEELDYSSMEIDSKECEELGLHVDAFYE